MSELTVAEAGRRGGRATAARHGQKHYQLIGRKGGLKAGRRLREIIAAGKAALAREGK